MLDLSKTFDSINRSKMISYLEEVLASSEMYMMKILIMNVVMKVQYGNEEGKSNMATRKLKTLTQMLEHVMVILFTCSHHCLLDKIYQTTT